MISISGVRGIVGESLTPEIAVRYAAAFGVMCRQTSSSRPRVALGRDGRVTGRILTNIISSTLLSTGVDVIAIGVCPTPTVKLAVERGGFAGGISVTASHNPIEWNGMKFIGPSGMFLNEEENRRLRQLADSPEAPFVRWDSLGSHSADDAWIRKHRDAVLAIEDVDRTLIRNRRFKVVLDCVNAAGGVIVPSFLRELGCEVVEMNCEVSGIFSHMPEPVPENLTDLCARVKLEEADLGIAVDPDVDRLVLIDERGQPVGEEYTVACAVKCVLERESRRGTKQTPGKEQVVVINLSTTKAVEDIASAYGARVLRTPVGEMNVAAAMKKSGAVIGGEGSGGVIFPKVHLGRDAIAGIGLILQMLAESGGTLSALKNTLPRYAIAKGKVASGEVDPGRAIARVAASHNGSARVNTEDGARIDFKDRWVHLRASNTEPIVRIIAEAPTPAEAAALVEQFRQQLLSSRERAIIP